MNAEKKPEKNIFISILGYVLYLLFLGAIALILIIDETRAGFEYATKKLPHIMGFVKFSILATSGELLSRKLITGKWQFRGIHIFTRAFVWGFIGLMIAYIFIIFPSGVKALIDKNMLPVIPVIDGNDILNKISTSFWISLFTNVFFGFQMMVFHRVTDTLIEEGRFWKRWRIAETWQSIDWKNIFGFVLPSIFWFWLPMHTLTFSLDDEYRVLMASALGIALGIILSVGKILSQKSN